MTDIKSFSGGDPVLTPGGPAFVLRIVDAFPKKEVWVRLITGVERWYAPQNLKKLIPEAVAVQQQQTLRTHIEKLEAALDSIGGLSRALRSGGPAPEDLQELSGALEEAVNTAHGALHGTGDAAVPEMKFYAEFCREAHNGERESWTRLGGPYNSEERAKSECAGMLKVSANKRIHFRTVANDERATIIQESHPPHGWRMRWTEPS